MCGWLCDYVCGACYQGVRDATRQADLRRMLLLLATTGGFEAHVAARLSLCFFFVFTLLVPESRSEPFRLWLFPRSSLLFFNEAIDDDT